MKRTFVLGLLGVVTLGCMAQILPASEITVYVGYADDLRSNPYFPNPWLGSPNTIFLGNTNPSTSFDAGAVRFENSGSSDITLSQGFHVDGFQNGASYELWDGLIGASGIVIHPGQNLILTQTSTDNTQFDTSDQPIIPDPANRTSAQPVIHATLNGTASSFVDTKQVLNTGGYDYGCTGGCYNTNESLQWRPIGTTGISDPAGNPNASVPEPGAAGLLAGAWAGSAFLLFRRKRQQ